MKHYKGILAMGILMVLVTFSCKKWKDPDPITDPRLTNPYCNDPDAVNYNWGFPGQPDNSKCFYPTDVFKGTYVFIDSVYRVRDGYFIYAQPETLQVYSMSKKGLAVLGMCNFADTLFMTAGINYIATIDTLIGDSITTRGQYWCRQVDTVTGNITNNRLDSLLYINFFITSDSGQTNHLGKARKL